MQRVNYDLARCLIIRELVGESRAESKILEQDELFEKILKKESTAEEEERFASLVTTEKFGYLDQLPSFGIDENDYITLFSLNDENNTDKTIDFTIDASVKCLIGEKRKAFNTLLDAEKNGLHVSRSLGDMYYYGIGVKKDIVQGQNCYFVANGYHEPTISVAGILGDYYYQIGVAFSSGQGVEKNISKALRNYYISFIEYGNIMGAYGLIGLLYNNNPERAAHFCRLAIKQIKDDEKIEKEYDKKVASWIYVAYANLIMNPSVKTPNNASAIECFEASAKLGNVTALYNLASMYENGYETEINCTKAIKYYKEAARLSNKRAIVARSEYNEATRIAKLKV